MEPFHTIVQSGEVGIWRWVIKKIPSSQYGPFFYSLQSRNEGKYGPVKTESEALASIDIFLSKKGLARVKTQTALFREYL